MNKPTVALAGVGIGAALMYMVDPVNGRRRRGRVRDLVVHTNRVVHTAVSATSHDLENRLSGLAARSRRAVAKEPAPEDDVLAARIRARLGHLVPHPGSIEAHVNKGIVTLSGTVTATEASHLVAGVKKIPGVQAVEDQLERRAANGEVAKEGIRWTPALRLLAGAAGLVLTALASREEAAKA